MSSCCLVRGPPPLPGFPLLVRGPPPLPGFPLLVRGPPPLPGFPLLVRGPNDDVGTDDTVQSTCTTSKASITPSIDCHICAMKCSPEPATPRPSCATAKLTQCSLDMCTEILGTETGHGCIAPEDLHVFSTTSMGGGATRFLMGPAFTGVKVRRGSKRRLPLPPPLSSMAGDRAIRITRCMEGGRRVLKATPRPPSSLFLAQRFHNGEGSRLRITLVSSCQRRSDSGFFPHLVLSYYEEEGFPRTEERWDGEAVAGEVGVGLVDGYERRSGLGCKEEEERVVAAAAAASGGVSRRHRGDGGNAIRQMPLTTAALA